MEKEVNIIYLLIYNHIGMSGQKKLLKFDLHKSSNMRAVFPIKQIVLLIFLHPIITITVNDTFWEVAGRSKPLNTLCKYGFCMPFVLGIVN